MTTADVETSTSRILIVDDHPLFREGLQQMINRESGWSVSGAAGDIEEALLLAKKTKHRIRCSTSPPLPLSRVPGFAPPVTGQFSRFRRTNSQQLRSMAYLRPHSIKPEKHLRKLKANFFSFEFSEGIGQCVASERIFPRCSAFID